MKVTRFVTDYDPGSSTPQGALGVGTPIAGGDLTGTHGVPVVSSVAGVTITGTPTAGQLIIATSGTAAHWATDPNVNPMTTKGDIITGDTGGTPTRLGAGTSTYVLTSNGAAAFPSWQAGGAGSSPLTTKGDLYGHSTVDARIPIGSNGQVLTADSAQTLGLKWAAGGGGAGAGNAPHYIQTFSGNGNSQNPANTISAAASGNAIVLGWNGVGRGITSITCTNTTFTKMTAFTSAGATHYEIWVGIVAGGSSGTTVTVNTGSSNFWTIQMVEVTDTLTPTAGTTFGVAMSGTIPFTIGPFSGVTSGHFIAAMAGADNTTVPFLATLNIPYVVVFGSASGQGNVLFCGYAPAGSTEVIFYSAPSSVGAVIMAEVT